MKEILKQLGIADINPGGFHGEWLGSGDTLDVHSPINGSPLAKVTQVTPEEYDAVAARAHEAFLGWRQLPAPKRGEVVRQLGNALRELKEPLGALVTIPLALLYWMGPYQPIFEGPYRTQQLVIPRKMVP